MMHQTRQHLKDAALETGLFAQVLDALPREIEGTTLAIGDQDAELEPLDAALSFYRARITTTAYVLAYSRDLTREAVERATIELMRRLHARPSDYTLEYRFDRWRVFPVTMGRDHVWVSELVVVRETHLEL